MTDTIFDINHILENKKSEMVKDLQSVLKIDSTLQASTLSAPFGEKINEALEQCLSIGNKLNLKTRNMAGYAGVVDLDLDDPSEPADVGILSHVDVVPANQNGWIFPPFSGEIADEKIFGRGAVDDKGPLIAALYAMWAIKELNLNNNKSIRHIIGTDEESNFNCIEYYKKHHPVPKIGFSPDGEFPVIYGEKGIAQWQASFDYDEADSIAKEVVHLKEFKAGDRPNMVPDQAHAILLGSEKVLTQINEYAEKQQLQSNFNDKNKKSLILSVTGKAAHASVPSAGSNAIWPLLKFLLSLPLLTKDLKYFIMILYQFFLESCFVENPDDKNKDRGPLTCNVGALTISEGKAIAKIDIRYPSIKVYDELKEKLKNLNILNLKEIIDKPPLIVDQNGFLVQTLLKVYNDFTNENRKPLFIGGGTYCRAIQNFVAFGPKFPEQKQYAHKANEHIEIDQLVKLSQIYAQALYSLAKKI